MIIKNVNNRSSYSSVTYNVYVKTFLHSQMLFVTKHMDVNINVNVFCVLIQMFF